MLIVLGALSMLTFEVELYLKIRNQIMAIILGSMYIYHFDENHLPYRDFHA